MGNLCGLNAPSRNKLCHKLFALHVLRSPGSLSDAQLVTLYGLLQSQFPNAKLTVADAPPDQPHVFRVFLGQKEVYDAARSGPI